MRLVVCQILWFLSNGGNPNKARDDSLRPRLAFLLENFIHGPGNLKKRFISVGESWRDISEVFKKILTRGQGFGQICHYYVEIILGTDRKGWKKKLPQFRRPG